MNLSFSIDLGGWQLVGLIIDYTIKIIAIGYVPEGRRPSSSTAWLLAILLIPFLGLPLFLLFGSPYINRRRHRIQKEASAMIEDIQSETPDFPEGLDVPEDVQSMLHLNRNLTNLPAVVGCNRAMHADYTEAIDAMARRVDAARNYIHVQTYIMAWDETTDVFFQALGRAVDRGIKVRLLFDQLGSLKYPGYLKLGKRLDKLGIDWRLTLPLQPWRLRFRRPDLRNHRKMIIIDGETAFMGSQNMIDRSYLKKENRKVGRQWIDVMVELGGPIVDSMEMIFATDWYLESGEQLQLHPRDGELEAPPRDSQANVVQLVPSGPGYTTEPALRMFNSLVYHAKSRLVICSPYFVPDESLLEAVATACHRGVRVDLLVSEKSDQFMVHHAQSSYYQSLLEVGVHIYQFPAPYILHTKFVLADPGDDGDETIGVLGSANLDMRSLGLNFEVSLFITRGDLLLELARITQAYMRVCHELTLDQWRRRGLARRYVDNVMRLTSALQ